LRYHKTRVAFFKNDGTYDVQDILLKPTPTTTLTYKGSNNYQAILVNYDYWDYFKYTIDDVSLAFFEQNLNKINKNDNDVLTRMIIWHDINEQVRDAKYKVTDYIETFRKFIF
jgi:triacylglycerol esterase/lipase EstA (alpha/beta hydrolase family)